MPVDTSIYSSLLRPVKSVADYDNEYEQQQSNKLARLLQSQQLSAGQMKMDEYTRAAARQNRLQAVLSGLAPGASLGQRQNALQSGGFWGEADALGKSQLDAQKTQSEIDAKKAEAVTKNAELIKNGLGYVFNNPTSEAAMQAIAIVEQQTGQDLSLYRQQVQSLQTPEQLKQWAAGHALEVEKSLPKTDITNMGNAQSFGATNPLTGVRTETGSAPIAVSPNTVASNETSLATNAASNARMAADAAAGRAVQMRGQNMTDARSRESIAQGGKPPAGYRQTAEGNLEAIPGGPADLKQQGAFNQDMAMLNNSGNSMDRLAAAANELKNHPGLPKMTGAMSIVPIIGGTATMPGTDAANAKAQLEALKSQVGFSVLQEMRNNSKTGGALGQVSDKENALLQANLGALDKAQSLEQYQASLQKIIDYTEGAKSRLRGAFNLKHNRDVGAQDKAAPKPRLRYNPATGKLE